MIQSELIRRYKIRLYKLESIRLFELYHMMHKTATRRL